LAFRTDVEPFAAAASDDPENLKALSELAVPDDKLLLIQRDPSPPLPGLDLVAEAMGVQMVSEQAVEQDQPPNVIPLDDGDASEMRALAELTRPGPFRTSTHKLGQFWGIRHEGRLIAMAGERLKIPGMSELSGVCTHPDWRGHGYARLLSAFVTSQIQSRGETPFLHAYADNITAIRLYERLGYAIRCEVAVQSFGRL
jgi:predicted GNAT family acetyltransferase